MNISLSLGEAQALAHDAVRGAGYNWGYAQEAASATRWLETHGLPGLQALSEHLMFADTREDAATPTVSVAPSDFADRRQLCPLATASTLTDHAQQLEMSTRLTEMQKPILLVPSIELLAQYGNTVISISWSTPGNSVTLYLDGTEASCQNGDMSVLLAPLAKQVIITLNGGALKQMETQLTRRSRALTSPTHYRHLTDYADRTRAPATEASRLSGAGAGLTDVN